MQGPALCPADLDALVALARPRSVEPLEPPWAWRLCEPAVRAGVLAACAARRLDGAFVPCTRMRSDVRIVAIDMDSTLITIECIDELAGIHGSGPEMAAITASTMRGEIDFRASLVRRVALLAGLPASALERVYAERLELAPGAERMLAGFRAVGAKTLLVSGGFRFFTDRLRARLGFDHAVGTALEIRAGRLTGRLEGPIVDAQAKATALARLRRALGDPGGLTVAIGDGANDLPLVRAADVSVAYRAKPVVRAAAAHALDHCGLDGVLNLFPA